jgi:hypothetical protein
MLDLSVPKHKVMSLGRLTLTLLAVSAFHEVLAVPVASPEALTVR